MSASESDDRPEPAGDGPEITITNEFTSVRIRKVLTRNGEQLEISSMRVPRSVQLDALVLESLTWRTLEDIAQGLETPFGPDAADAANADEEPRGMSRWPNFRRCRSTHRETRSARARRWPRRQPTAPTW